MNKRILTYAVGLGFLLASVSSLQAGVGVTIGTSKQERGESQELRNVPLRSPVTHHAHEEHNEANATEELVLPDIELPEEERPIVTPPQPDVAVPAVSYTPAGGAPTSIQGTEKVLHFHQGDFSQETGFFVGLANQQLAGGTNLTDDSKKFALSTIGVAYDDFGGATPYVQPLAPQIMKLNNKDLDGTSGALDIVNAAAKQNPLWFNAEKGLSHLVLAGGAPVVVLNEDQKHLYYLSNEAVINGGTPVLTNADAGVAVDYPLKGAGLAAKVCDIAASRGPVPNSQANLAAPKQALFAAIAANADLAAAGGDVSIAPVVVDGDHLAPLDAAATNNLAIAAANAGKTLSLANNKELAFNNVATWKVNAGDINLWWDDRYNQLFGTVAGIQPGAGNGNAVAGLFHSYFNYGADNTFLNTVMFDGAAAALSNADEKTIAGSIFGANRAAPAVKDITVNLYRPRTMHTSTDKDYLIVTGGVETPQYGSAKAWVNALPIMPPTDIAAAPFTVPSKAGQLAKKTLNAGAFAALNAAADAPTVDRKDAKVFAVDNSTPYIVGRHPSFLAAVLSTQLAADKTLSAADAPAATGFVLQPGSELAKGSKVVTNSVLGQDSYILASDGAGTQGYVKFDKNTEFPAGTTLTGAWSQGVEYGAGTTFAPDTNFPNDVKVSAQLDVTLGDLKLAQGSILKAGSQLGNTTVLPNGLTVGTNDQNIAADMALGGNSYFAPGSTLNGAADAFGNGGGAPNKATGLAGYGSVVKFDEGGNQDNQISQNTVFAGKLHAIQAPTAIAAGGGFSVVSDADIELTGGVAKLSNGSVVTDIGIKAGSAAPLEFGEHVRLGVNTLLPRTTLFKAFLGGGVNYSAAGPRIAGAPAAAGLGNDWVLLNWTGAADGKVNALAALGVNDGIKIPHDGEIAGTVANPAVLPQDTVLPRFTLFWEANGNAQDYNNIGGANIVGAPAAQNAAQAAADQWVLLKREQAAANYGKVTVAAAGLGQHHKIKIVPDGKIAGTAGAPFVIIPTDTILPQGTKITNNTGGALNLQVAIKQNDGVTDIAGLNFAANGDVIADGNEFKIIAVNGWVIPDNVFVTFPDAEQERTKPFIQGQFEWTNVGATYAVPANCNLTLGKNKPQKFMPASELQQNLQIQPGWNNTADADLDQDTLVYGGVLKAGSALGGASELAGLEVVDAANALVLGQGATLQTNTFLPRYTMFKEVQAGATDYTNGAVLGITGGPAAGINLPVAPNNTEWFVLNSDGTDAKRVVQNANALGPNAAVKIVHDRIILPGGANYDAYLPQNMVLPIGTQFGAVAAGNVNHDFTPNFEQSTDNGATWVAMADNSVNFTAGEAGEIAAGAFSAATNRLLKVVGAPLKLENNLSVKFPAYDPVTGANADCRPVIEANTKANTGVRLTTAGAVNIGSDVKLQEGVASKLAAETLVTAGSTPLVGFKAEGGALHVQDNRLGLVDTPLTGNAGNGALKVLAGVIKTDGTAVAGTNPLALNATTKVVNNAAAIMVGSGGLGVNDGVLPGAAIAKAGSSFGANSTVGATALALANDLTVGAGHIQLKAASQVAANSFIKGDAVNSLVEVGSVTAPGVVQFTNAVVDAARAADQKVTAAAAQPSANAVANAAAVALGYADAADLAAKKGANPLLNAQDAIIQAAFAAADSAKAVTAATAKALEIEYGKPVISAPTFASPITAVATIKVKDSQGALLKGAALGTAVAPDVKIPAPSWNVTAGAVTLGTSAAGVADASTNATLVTDGNSKLAENSVIAKDSNVIGADAIFGVSATDLQVIGDSVYVALEGDRSEDNGVEAGIFKSTAVFDHEGKVRGWTPWHRLGGSNDAAAFFGYNTMTGSTMYLTSPDGKSFLDYSTNPPTIVNPATIAKLTGWSTGDDTPGGVHNGRSLGSLLRAKFAPQGGSDDTDGVYGLFDFGPDTLGFAPYNHNTQDPKVACMVATGVEKVALIETGRYDKTTKSFLPTREFNDQNVVVFDASTTDVRAAGLRGLGRITCAEWSRQDDAAKQNYFFVGGENGLAVLKNKNTSTGFPGGGFRTVNASSLNNYSFLKLTDATGANVFANVRKIVADEATGYVYVVTKSAVYRLNVDETVLNGDGKLTHQASGAGKGYVKIATAANSKAYNAGADGSLVNGGEFTDLMILKSVDNAAHPTTLLLGTTNGLFANVAATAAGGAGAIAVATVIDDAQTGVDGAGGDKLQDIKWQAVEYAQNTITGPVDKNLNFSSTPANKDDAEVLKAVLRLEPVNLHSGGRLMVNGNDHTFEGDINVYATGKDNNDIRLYRLSANNGEVKVVKGATSSNAAGRQPYVAKLGAVDPYLLDDLDSNLFLRTLEAADLDALGNALPELLDPSILEDAIVGAVGKAGTARTPDSVLDLGNQYNSLMIPQLCAVSDSASGAVYLPMRDGVRVNE